MAKGRKKGGKLLWIGIVVFVAVVGSVLASKRVTPIGWGCYGHVNAPGGLAIGGYDPVAYFTAGKAMPGDGTITAEWNGATWRFATATNKAKFEKAPARYAPQIGGFCSFAASRGATAVCDPTVWTIQGGKLYVFNSAKFRDQWLGELKDGVLVKTEASWAKHEVASSAR